MPRISRLNRSEVAPELREVYDKFLRDRGNVPYFFRTLAHRAGSIPAPPPHTCMRYCKREPCRPQTQRC